MADGQPPKYVCNYWRCAWTGLEPLRAADPFNEGDELLACPKCRDQTIMPACDIQGCWEVAEKAEGEGAEMNTCRFCGKDSREDAHRLNLIKYGVRHYAHPDCLLQAKGAETWEVLHDWQVESFPYFAAHRNGLADSLGAEIERRKSRGAPSALIFE